MTPRQGPSIWAGAVIVAARELRELLHNRQVLVQYAIFGGLMPVFLGWVLAEGAMRAGPNLQYSPVRMFLAQIAILPFVGSLQATLQSFAGERAERTLAPLLATPLHNRSIFGAKVAASYLPSLVVSWVGVLVFVTTATVKVSRTQTGVTNAMLLQMLALASVTGFAFVTVAVVVSTKTSSVKSAQALAGVLTAPLFIGALYLASKMTTAPGLVLSLCIGGLVPVLLLLWWVSTKWRREEAVLARSA